MADKPPEVILIDVFDEIGVNIEPSTGRLTVDGQSFNVSLSQAQRTPRPGKAGARTRARRLRRASSSPGRAQSRRAGGRSSP
jgi:hypothetical protein